jgi:hypothetical protein
MAMAAVRAARESKKTNETSKTIYVIPPSAVTLEPNILSSLLEREDS